jgi:hypothetical protein
MGIEDGRADEKWNRAARDETGTERLDRNWASLLQELRVTQTGVQLLTGFLLTLPFQERFSALDGVMRTVYLVTVAASVGSTVLLVAPVPMHRVMFRRHRLATLVSAAHWCAIAGLALLGVALGGVVVIVFDVVAGRSAALIAGGGAAVALVCFWMLLPLWQRRRPERSTDDATSAARP